MIEQAPDALEVWLNETFDSWETEAKRLVGTFFSHSVTCDETIYLLTPGQLPDFSIYRWVYVYVPENFRDDHYCELGYKGFDCEEKAMEYWTATLQALDKLEGLLYGEKSAICRDDAENYDENCRRRLEEYVTKHG